MAANRSRQIRTILLLVIITTAFLLFRCTRSSDTPDPAAIEMSDPVDVTSKLKVSVRQVSISSPPKLAIAVTNTHSSPVTILTWNSPLDSLALQLGLVSFVPAGSDAAIQIPTIQIRRKMPPGPESFVEIGAGQTKEQELELKGPIVPLDKLRGKMSAVCSGEWMAVWLSEADAITKASLEKAGASEDAFKGHFQSEAVEIEI
ncbi:hypothetical protein GGS26DRAFT_84859 [Hypomontagnella submonticulosa]|nr:hypothetical protein GGS26DRAFT_84859 [Hypomontagnella submonticulosa]